MSRILALLGCLALLACGGASTAAQLPLPQRAQSAGEGMLRAVPAGADLVLEVDLARLRNNAVVGKLLESVAPPEALRSTDLLQQSSAVLLCIYDIGDASKQLIILRASAEELAGARALGDHLFALGDPALATRAEALMGPGSGPDKQDSMAEDRDFLRLRAEAMPEKAESASARVVARLDFDARVAVASEVAMSDVPVSIALWADAVDDLAIIVDMATTPDTGIERLERAMKGLRKRLARAAWVRAMGLAPPMLAARVIRSQGGVRVVFVVGPQRLQHVVDRIFRQVTGTQP